MIEIKNITKTFNDNIILNDINITFGESEISVIVGKSGAGKTTLFRIVAGLEEADSGTVVSKQDNNIGMVFQSFQLYPHLSVLNNLVIPQRFIMKLSKREAIIKSIKILRSLKIEYLNNQYPSSLSGGEKQRVAIARALAIDKDVILLDEPTSSLDTENIGILINSIKELKARGITIIIITHDIVFAEKVADSIYELKDSKLSPIL